MRWKKQKDPLLGEYRNVTKFAWLPIKLDNGFTIWFEKYKAYQKFSTDYSGEFYWRDIEIYQ